MKLWLVMASKVDYDQYDAFVVRAKNAEEAVELGTFEPRQGKVIAEEIPVKGPAQVILGSYNAG